MSDQYSLVMPFIVVTSKGGPFDDAAYCAGYEIGKLDAALDAEPRLHQVTIRTLNVPQADLVAMQHGYTMRASEPDPDGGMWTFCEFEPATKNAP